MVLIHPLIYKPDNHPTRQTVIPSGFCLTGFLFDEGGASA